MSLIPQNTSRHVWYELNLYFILRWFINSSSWISSGQLDTLAGRLLTGYSLTLHKAKRLNIICEWKNKYGLRWEMHLEGGGKTYTGNLYTKAKDAKNKLTWNSSHKRWRVLAKDTGNKSTCNGWRHSQQIS